MKRTMKQTPGMDRRPVREHTTLSVADLAQVSGGDVIYDAFVAAATFAVNWANEILRDF